MTDEQDQALQVEMMLRDEDVCRYCGRVMPLEALRFADGIHWPMCSDLNDISDCLEARSQRDKRTAG
jgi:hypothetical protein